MVYRKTDDPSFCCIIIKSTVISVSYIAKLASEIFSSNCRRRIQPYLRKFEKSILRVPIQCGYFSQILLNRIP